MPSARPRRDSWPSIWSRRAISVPAVAILAALFSGAAPLWALAALLADAAAGQGRALPRTRALTSTVPLKSSFQSQERTRRWR